MQRIGAFLLILVSTLSFSQDDDGVYNYMPLVLGLNIQNDAFSLNNGMKFNNSDNGQIAYLTVNNNNAYCLAEMDFLPAWNRQSKFSASSNDTIVTNNFQLMRTYLAFYSRGVKKFKLGGVGVIDWSLKEAAFGTEDGHTGPVTGPKILAAASGLNFGIGLAAVHQIDNGLILNHNVGIASLGNAQNDPNWYGRYYFWLTNATYPLTPRLSANGYFNMQYYQINNHQRLANGNTGSILTWQLRFGIGIHVGRDPMFEK